MHYSFWGAQVERILSRVLGFPVSVGSVEVSKYGVLRIQDLIVSDDVTRKEIIRVAEVTADYQAKELLSQRLHRLTVQQPQIFLTPEILTRMQERFRPKVAVEAATQQLKVTEKELREQSRSFEIGEISIQGGQIQLALPDHLYEAIDAGLFVRNLSSNGMEDFRASLTFQEGGKSAGTFRSRIPLLRVDQRALRDVEMNLEEFDLHALHGVLRPWLKGTLQSAKIAGTVTGRLQAANLQEGVRANWKAKDLNAETADGLYALAGFSAEGTLETRADPAVKSLRTQFSTTIHGAPLLLGSFYQDWTGKTFHLAAAMTVNEESKRLLIETMQGRWEGLGEINASGSYDLSGAATAAFDLKAGLSGLTLASLRSWGFGEVLQGTSPAFFPPEAEAKFAAEVTVKGNSNRLSDLGLRVFLEDYQIANESSPFRIANGTVRVDGTARRGRTGSVWHVSTRGPLSLSWSRLGAGPLEFSPGTWNATIANNRLTSSAPLQVTVMNGKLSVSRLDIGDIFDPMQNAKAAARIDGFDLERLSEALEIYPLKGTLEFDFPDLVLRDGALSTTGSIRGSVFGGRVEVTDLWALNLPSANRELGANIRFGGIHLGWLSEATTFGFVTGVLDGRIEALHLYGGMPVGFDAEVKTVKWPGVKQEVGIEAVKKIAIFSGASGALHFLDQGIYKFIDRYYYEGFGVRARLFGGVLRMKALETRGDQKLFLKGRTLPPRIDVVYNEGGSEILFESFLNQMKAVQVRMKEKAEGAAAPSK